MREAVIHDHGVPAFDPMADLTDGVARLIASRPADLASSVEGEILCSVYRSARRVFDGWTFCLLPSTSLES